MKFMRYSTLVAAVLGASIIQAQYTAVDLNPPGQLSSSFRHYENGSLIGTLFDDQGAMSWGVWSDDTTVQTLVDNSVAELYLFGTDGIQHVGWGRDNSFTYHARVWNGLGGGVDLHPAGPYYVSSQAADAHSGRQVGSVYEQVPNVTMKELGFLWFGSAASAVNLTPNEWGGGVRGVHGNQQVGYLWEFAGFGLLARACIWNDTPGSVQLLHPDYSDGSVGMATDGVQQVGHTTHGTFPYTQATLWEGTAASAVNLHPDGYYQSVAWAVANGRQAGFATTLMPGQANGPDHAAVWSGTKASFIDLHQFLPANAYDSQATGIDAQGNVYGYATMQEGFYLLTKAYKWTFDDAGSNFSIAAFQQPVNDPPTPESSFKKNQVVKLKFQLLDENGDPTDGGLATVSLEQLGATTTPVNEADYVMPSDNGSVFRFDPVTLTYSYNLGTKNLVAGYRYRVTATVAGVTHSVTFSLR